MNTDRAAQIAAALRLIDAAVPRTAGLSYDSIHSISYGCDLLVAWEDGEEDGPILVEAWLRGVDITTELSPRQWDSVQDALTRHIDAQAKVSRDNYLIDAYIDRMAALGVA